MAKKTSTCTMLRRPLWACTFPVIQRSGLTSMMTSMISIATASTLRKSASSMFTAMRAPRIDPTTVGMDKSSAPRTSSLPWR